MLNEFVNYTSLGIDCLVITTFVLVGIYGYKRAYRLSLMQLGVQISAIIASALITYILGAMIVNRIPEKLLTIIKNLIPDHLYYLIQPIENDLIAFIIYIILFIVFFVIFKSFLGVFSKNYEWNQYILKGKELDHRVEKGISVVSTLLTTYTYMIVIIIIMAFPILNLVHKNSVSYFLAKTVPDVTQQVKTVYKEYEVLNEAMKVYGEYLNDIYDGTKINFSEIKRLLEMKEIDSTVIETAYQQLIPRIANEESYLSYFEGNHVEVAQMSHHIRTMTSYIDSGVLSMEIFNFYYKELIESGTYDKLIKDEAVSVDSIQLLIQSNLLNEEIVEKLKEYL